MAPIFHRGKERWEKIGKTSDFTEDTYRQVVFTETPGIGDAGEGTQAPAVTGSEGPGRSTDDQGQIPCRQMDPGDVTTVG